MSCIWQSILLFIMQKKISNMLYQRSYIGYEISNKLFKISNVVYNILYKISYMLNIYSI